MAPDREVNMSFLKRSKHIYSKPLPPNIQYAVRFSQSKTLNKKSSPMASFLFPELIDSSKKPSGIMLFCGYIWITVVLNHRVFISSPSQTTVLVARLTWVAPARVLGGTAGWVSSRKWMVLGRKWTQFAHSYKITRFYLFEPAFTFKCGLHVNSYLQLQFCLLHICCSI